MNSDCIARKYLEALGYQVKVIPTSDHDRKKEADFIIGYDDHIAIVEAKLKEDDKKIAEYKDSALASGEVSIVEGKLGRNETISGVLRNSAKQLASSSDKEHDFKIVSFLATGSNVKTKADQFKDTIYGSTSITHRSTYKPCYFYRNADFLRRKIIDGAIVGYIFNGTIFLELCLNPYSNNYEKLKTSSFIKPFGTAIIDPVELERQGLAYIPDEHIERKLNEFQLLSPMYNPILTHLMKKYNTGFLIPADFNSPEFSVRYED